MPALPRSQFTTRWTLPPLAFVAGGAVVAEARWRRTSAVASARTSLCAIGLGKSIDPSALRQPDAPLVGSRGTREKKKQCAGHSRRSHLRARDHPFHSIDSCRPPRQPLLAPAPRSCLAPSMRIDTDRSWRRALALACCSCTSTYAKRIPRYPGSLQSTQSTAGVPRWRAIQRTPRRATYSALRLGMKSDTPTPSTGQDGGQ
jgi:hypothetical protein